MLVLCYDWLITIEQTVEIPANHRLTIDVPREVPAGRAKVALTFSPLLGVHRMECSEKIRLSRPMVDELLAGEALQSLTGILRNDTSAEAIREERLGKHDYTA